MNVMKFNLVLESDVVLN